MRLHISGVWGAAMPAGRYLSISLYPLYQSLSLSLSYSLYSFLFPLIKFLNVSFSLLSLPLYLYIVYDRSLSISVTSFLFISCLLFISLSLSIFVSLPLHLSPYLFVYLSYSITLFHLLSLFVSLPYTLPLQVTMLSGDFHHPQWTALFIVCRFRHLKWFTSCDVLFLCVFNTCNHVTHSQRGRRKQTLLTDFKTSPGLAVPEVAVLSSHCGIHHKQNTPHCFQCWYF